MLFYKFAAAFSTVVMVDKASAAPVQLETRQVNSGVGMSPL